MASIIIAISSYGSHRVKNPHTGQTVSAYKIGYSSAASAVLLALYGDGARNVSSKHASYHYIQIDAEVSIRRSHILLKIDDAQLAQVEALTRQAHRPAVYRWLDGAWREFPGLKSPEYRPVTGRPGPDFNPTGMRIVAAATREAEAAVEGILVEKSQRSQADTPWWWLRGDTYPHRDTLKRWGCRWSKKRQAWYFKGATLPDAVQQLIDTHNAQQPEAASNDHHDPCHVEEAAAVLGMRVKDGTFTEQGATDGPPRLFALGEMVYARHDLETPGGRIVPTGTRGTITRLYNRNSKHGWSYDVDFAETGTGWFFEGELTGVEPAAGIRVTRGSVVPPGATPPVSDGEIKRTLVASGQQPEAIDLDERAAPLPERSEETDEDEPKVRITKPVLDISDGAEPDAVITAIHQTKAKSLPAPQPSTNDFSNRRNLTRIPQTACGELTGSITGSVWCFGWAIHEGICVYVNMGGPRMAVEAIRAKLAKGDVRRTTA